MTILKTHRHALATLAAALAVSFGAASPAVAARIECKPTIKVENKKPASIKVLKLEYTVLGKAHDEGLDNKRLAAGEEDEWRSVRLQDAAIGNVISATRVQFKNDNSGAGDGYGPAVWSKSFPHSFNCGDNHNYIHVIE